MSDSGNSFGEALESMSTNTKKALGGTIADFTKSATNQVKGTGGISGSFTPGQSQGGQQNPNVAPNLSGGDLFSPDLLAGKPQPKADGPLAQKGPKPLTQAGQQLAQDPTSKTPEEAAKIQQIEQELRNMHQEYYQDFLAKAEGRDRKTQVQEQEKAQLEQKKEMEDLQKKEEKKASDDQTLQRAQRAAEVKGGLG